MKAGLIGAVAIGGAIAATLIWTRLAPVEPDPRPLVEAPTAGTDSGGGPPAAEAPIRDPSAPAPEPSSPAPAARDLAAAASAPATDREGIAPGPGLAAGDPPAPAPESGRPGRAGAPERMAAVAPGADGPAAAPPGTAAPERAPQVAPRAEPQSPSFDIVRVDADGQAVIAGRTTPNERVEILLDGRIVETMLADASGRFVAVLSAGPSPDARELRLRVTLPDPPLPAEPEPPRGEASAETSAAHAPGAAPGPDRTAPPGAALSGPAPPPAGAAGPPVPVEHRNGRVAAITQRSGALPATPGGEAADAADAEGAAPAQPAPLPAGKASPRAAGATAPTQPPPPAGSPAPPPSFRSSAPSRAGGAGGTGQQVGSSAPPSPADPGNPTPPGDPGGDSHLLSDAVIILPTERAGDAPALVRVQDDQLALLHPGGAPSSGVVLDQLTQQPDGDLLLRGRARPGHAVRVYGNGRAIDTVAVADGGWSLTVPDADAGEIRLFRLDEIARSGAVASRVEVPFQPSEAASHVLRDRRITVQRGDNLWRIAEQHYGEGIRYSLIFGANGDLIRDPDLIYPDQVFTIPELVEAE